MTDVEPIAQGKLIEVLGQLIRLRYFGAVQQDWDHGNIALKRRPDLDSHKVVRIIQTASSSFITGVEPVWSDHRKQYLALGDLII